MGEISRQIQLNRAGVRSGSSLMVSILTAALAAYLALVGFMFVAQRTLMYHPGPINGSPAENGAPEFGVLTRRNQDGLDLTSWYAPPGDGGPILIFLQGNAGSISDRAAKVRPYLEAGYGVMLVGYRGFGGNPGSPTETGLYEDAGSALRYLRGDGVAPAQWILYGESLGTGAAVELARQYADAGNPVGAVVLEAPFSSMGDAAARHYPYVPARLLVRDKYDSIAKITAINAPLFVIHGDADRVVPQILGRRLFDAARQPKEALWIEGAGHNDLYDFGAAARVLRFAARHLTNR